MVKRASCAFKRGAGSCVRKRAFIFSKSRSCRSQGHFAIIQAFGWGRQIRRDAGHDIFHTPGRMMARDRRHAKRLSPPMAGGNIRQSTQHYVAGIWYN